MNFLSPLNLITPAWPAPDNVVALITTRAGGVSKSPFQSLNLALHVGDDAAAVAMNRHLLASNQEQPLEWQWLEQVHGDRVVRVEKPQTAVAADGLITGTAGLACCVLTADCLSVFIAAADGSEVAVAHAGWRGMLAGIIANTVRAMSVPAEQLLVFLGPAIGPCHFEVGGEVRDAFLASWSDSIGANLIAACFQPAASTGKYLADLFQLAALQLAALGVRQVSGSGECTFCEQEKYYSFRRSGKTGRMLSMIYLKNAP